MTAAGDSDPVRAAWRGATLADAPESVAEGGVALIAQGGRVALALLRAARRRGLGLRHVIDADSEGAPGLPDLLRAVAAEDGTRVIALCLGTIGDGSALRAALGEARRSGRLVVALCASIGEEFELAPGVTPARVRDALLEAEGVICVASHRALLDTALHLDSLGRTGLPAGRGVAILTGGGGGGVIAADLCGRHGLTVPSLTPETRAALVPLVPAIASTANPVDLTPEMFNEKFYDRFPQVLDIVAADPGVDAIFLPTTFNAPRGNVVAAQVLAEFHARSPKPVLIAAGGHAEMAPVFAAHRIAPIADTAEAAVALAQITARAAFREPAPMSLPMAPVADWPADIAQAAQALPARLAEAGFTLALPRETGTAEDALRDAALELGFPLALAALPRAGGRAIGDICDLADLAAARRKLLARPGVTGFTLRREVPGVLPLRILGFRDPAFGPVLALGAGGVQAQVVDDLALGPAPLDEAAALALLGRSRAVQHAQRMDRGLALDGAAQAVARVAQLIAAAPWPRFLLQLDPVLLRGGAVQVLDAALSFVPDTGSPG